ncbi:MAG: hypothetical protein ABJD07_15710, partial [Gemmatimonadaceae bacterium]
LERNDVIESFPIGRRLAFDEAKGRLWVVCRRCTRWNLTPVEERWEAIEQCERLYRDTRARASTENIGLARLPEGLELVRIGKPLRPEFAAWRYGDQFDRRRKRAMMAGGAGAAVAVVSAPFATAVTTIFVLGYLVPSLAVPYTAVRDYLVLERPVARVRVGDAKLNVRVKHLRDSTFVSDEPGDEPVLELAHDAGRESIRGSAALRVASALLARTNMAGGSRSEVRDAVRRIEKVGDPAHFFVSASRLSRRLGGRMMPKMRGIGALNLSPIERLALEMALHEETERRALEGELALLEDAWREAEEVAGISDGLFLPIEIDARHR